MNKHRTQTGKHTDQPYVTHCFTPALSFLHTVLTMHLHKRLIESKKLDKTRVKKSLSKYCLVAWPLDVSDLHQT